MIVVVAGGAWAPEDHEYACAWLSGIEPTAVVCADGGFDQALSLGLHPTHLVGDFDSISSAGRARALEDATVIVAASVDKDETDLELALGVAVGLGGAPLLVVDGGGGRLDHALANVSVLASHRWSDRRVTAVIGSALLRVVHGPGSVEIYGAPGMTVSLVPLAGDAGGVTTKGLRWPLVGEVLLATAARGVSNVLVASTASVALDTGTLAVISPLTYE
jgi:thiamine pyrophosphokinase